LVERNYHTVGIGENHAGGFEDVENGERVQFVRFRVTE
jgi:hypothetical protein